MNLANAGVNDQAVELLEPSVEHRVLDVGFGGGVALSQLAQRAGFVAGTNPSEPALRAARKRFHDEIEAGRVQLTQAPVDAIPFKDGSFDRVLTVNSIYFWPQPDRGLREILRLLKLGGRLVLATETTRVPSSFARHGFTLYTEGEQADLLRGAGFSDVRFERRDRFVFALAAKS